VVLPVAVAHNLRAVLVLAALSASFTLAGCGWSVESQPPAISVSLSPTMASIEVLQSQQFTSIAQNDTQNKGVTWSLTQSGSTCTPSCGSLATITAHAATYTAPLSAPKAATVTLTATSVADNTKSAFVTITIIAPTHLAATLEFCDDGAEKSACTSKDAFSLTQIRDLFIWVNWQVVPTGPHTQQLDIFMPQGHALYIRYSDGFQITDAPVGSALVLRSMPVAGTWITQRQLTGTWEVDASLDGKLVSSKTFQFLQ
jgi:hypothetical protein